jgi:hypothetical protein
MSGQQQASHGSASTQELAADIRATRRELAATVEALAYKTDVRARLRDTVVRGRTWLRATYATAGDRMRRVRSSRRG